MAAKRQQLNLRVPEGLVRKIQSISSFHRKSVNEWAVAALSDCVEEELKTHPVEALGQELAAVAERYVPGRALSMEEMLALADTYADADTADGVQTVHVRARRKR